LPIAPNSNNQLRLDLQELSKFVSELSEAQVDLSCAEQQWRRHIEFSPI
jgi:hypothetical protein